MLPLILVVFQIVTLGFLYYTSTQSGYHLKSKDSVPTTIIYFVVIAFLVAYGIYINSDF